MLRGKDEFTHTRDEFGGHRVGRHLPEVSGTQDFVIPRPVAINAVVKPDRHFSCTALGDAVTGEIQLAQAVAQVRQCMVVAMWLLIVPTQALPHLRCIDTRTVLPQSAETLGEESVVHGVLP